MANSRVYDIGVIGSGIAVQMANKALSRYKKVAIFHLPDTQTANPNFDFFEDPSDFFEKRIVKSLYLATPVHTHAKYIEKAVKSGLPCLVEKPLLMNSAEAHAIHPDAEKWIAVSFKKRYSPLATKICKARETAHRQECRIRYTYLAPHPGVGHWKVRPEFSGGGIIMDVGSHVFDFLEHCIGKIEYFDLKSIYEDDVHHADKYVSVSLGFEDNSIAEVNLGWADGPGLQKVDFVQGETEISWQKSDQMSEGVVVKVEQQTVEEFNYTRDDEYFGLFDAFQNFVDGKESDVPFWSEGLRNLEVIETVKRLGLMQSRLLAGR